MRNARRFDDHVTIGRVPAEEDIRQLKSLGFRTLVDVRDERERFGGFVEQRAIACGLTYVSLPIAREAITITNVLRFYDLVYAPDRAPVYAFSRFGKKPLTFLLLFEAAAHYDPVSIIFRRATTQFGVSLYGDLPLQQFVVELINTGNLDPIRDAVRTHRPELLESAAPFRRSRRHRADRSTDIAVDVDEIAVMLGEASERWSTAGDVAALRSSLEVVLAALESSNSNG